ncbi:MAG: MYG1 family protein [Candidatus Caldarchaeum sp.]
MVEKTIVTHGGNAHRDDFLTCAILLEKYPACTIIRTDDKKTIASADIVVDVGGVYDPAGKRYDHHQDLNLPCSLILVLEHEFGIKKYPQAIRFLDHADRFGLDKAKSMFNQTVMPSMIENAVLAWFSEQKEIPQWSNAWFMLLNIGRGLYKELRDYNECANVVWSDVKNGITDFMRYDLPAGVILITSKNIRTDTLIQVFADNHERIIGIIKPSTRGGGFEIISANNNPVFRPANITVFPEIFTHKTGFLRVVDASWDEITSRIDVLLKQGLNHTI